VKLGKPGKGKNPCPMVKNRIGSGKVTKRWDHLAGEGEGAGIRRNAASGLGNENPLNQENRGTSFTW